MVRAQPDATFVELLVVLKKRGIRASRSALWPSLFKKKSLCASERQPHDVVRAAASGFASFSPACHRDWHLKSAQS
jgi:hypothetical protein